MRRGQIQQVFIFLVAVLVIGASIFLGVRLIGGLKDTACEANDAGFQSDIKAMLDRGEVFGSTNEEALAPPCDAVALCFVDPVSLGLPVAGTGAPATIKSLVRNHVNTTIYLVGRERTVPVMFDERVMLRPSPADSTSPDPVCIGAVGGRFKFRTEGYGRYVRIIKD